MSEEKQIATLVGLDLILSPEHYKEITKLQQENKQLKSILTELEEWLKEQGNNGIDEWGNHYTVCLYKLNKLKKKYSIGDKE